MALNKWGNEHGKEQSMLLIVYLPSPNKNVYFLIGYFILLKMCVCILLFLQLLSKLDMIQIQALKPDFFVSNFSLLIKSELIFIFLN